MSDTHVFAAFIIGVLLTSGFWWIHSNGLSQEINYLKQINLELAQQNNELSKDFEDLSYTAAQRHHPFARLPVGGNNRSCGEIRSGLPEVVIAERLKQEIIIRSRFTAASQRPDVVDQGAIYPWTVDAQGNGGWTEPPFIRSEPAVCVSRQLHYRSYTPGEFP